MEDEEDEEEGQEFHINEHAVKNLFFNQEHSPPPSLSHRIFTAIKLRILNKLHTYIGQNKKVAYLYTSAALGPEIV